MLGESRKLIEIQTLKTLVHWLQKRECVRVSLFGLFIRHCWIFVNHSNNLKDCSKETTDIVINTFKDLEYRH